MRHLFPALALLMLFLAFPLTVEAQGYSTRHSAEHLLTERSSYGLMFGSERNSGARIYMPQLQARMAFSYGSRFEIGTDISGRIFSFPDLDEFDFEISFRTVEFVTDLNFYYNPVPILILGGGAGLATQFRSISIPYDSERDFKTSLGLNLNVIVEADTGRFFPHARFSHTRYFSDGVPNHRFFLVGLGLRFVN